MIFKGWSNEILLDMTATFGIAEAYAIVQSNTRDMNELIPFDTFVMIIEKLKIEHIKRE